MVYSQSWDYTQLLESENSASVASSASKCLRIWGKDCLSLLPGEPLEGLLSKTPPLAWPTSLGGIF